jgi:hypothetical protein
MLSIGTFCIVFPRLHCQKDLPQCKSWLYLHIGRLQENRFNLNSFVATISAIVNSVSWTVWNNGEYSIHRPVYGIEGFGESADLIDLIRINWPLPRPPVRHRIGYKISSNKLDLPLNYLLAFPAVPVFPCRLSYTANRITWKFMRAIISSLVFATFRPYIFTIW